MWRIFTPALSGGVAKLLLIVYRNRWISSALNALPGINKKNTLCILFNASLNVFTSHITSSQSSYKVILLVSMLILAFAYLLKMPRVSCVWRCWQVVFRRRWSNVSLQQVQANVNITESQTDTDNAGDDDPWLCFTTDEAFNGGGCLQLSTAADASRQLTRYFGC